MFLWGGRKCIGLQPFRSQTVCCQKAPNSVLKEYKATIKSIKAAFAWPYFQSISFQQGHNFQFDNICMCELLSFTLNINPGGNSTSCSPVTQCKGSSSTMWILYMECSTSLNDNPAFGNILFIIDFDRQAIDGDSVLIVCWYYCCLLCGVFVCSVARDTHLLFSLPFFLSTFDLYYWQALAVV